MSAASAAQLAANQANALLSTGPTTRNGKRRSSLNATRHGLTGRVVVLPSEEMSVYQAFSQELLASLDPQTPLERELAQTVVDQQWRLKRIRTIEDGMVVLSESETGADHSAVDSALAAAQAFLENSKAFVNLTIYEQRIHRIMEKALARLKQLHRKKGPGAVPDGRSSQAAKAALGRRPALRSAGGWVRFFKRATGTRSSPSRA